MSHKGMRRKIFAKFCTFSQFLINKQSFLTVTEEITFLNQNSFLITFKGSDRLCKVVKLSMQCCGKLFSDSFEMHIKLSKDL